MVTHRGAAHFYFKRAAQQPQRAAMSGHGQVDEYLSTLDPERCTALSALRTLIRQVVPEAIESMQQPWDGENDNDRSGVWRRGDVLPDSK